MLNRCLLLILLTCLSHSAAGITPQQVSTKVSVYDDIFFSEAGLIPLPENAIELDPKNAAAYYNRGIGLVYQRKFKEAIRDFEKASLLDQNLVTKAQEQIRYCMSRTIRVG